MSLPWVPARTTDMELLHRGPSWGGAEAGPLLVLVRAHTRCLGLVPVELGQGETLEDHREDLVRLLDRELSEHARLHGCTRVPDQPARCLERRRSLLRDAPTVSVVIATHDRAPLLRLCLDSVLAQEVSPLEVVVVDNARSSDEAERLVAEPTYASRGVCYVREDRPGLGRAHNAGVARARGDVVAITDDDVLVDRFWLSALLEAVADGAGCCTGLILPLELRTREQSWVEQYGGFARGFERTSYRLADPPEHDVLFPFSAGRFGSGANMAFTRRTLDLIGGFDDALGAGTPAQGGDDLAAFARTVLAGETLTYQPDAVVRHRHHEDLAGVERMARGYGVGLGAYLTSLVWSRPSTLASMLRRAPAGVRHLMSPTSTKNAARLADYPRRLVVTERVGLLTGPFRYVQSRRASRGG